MCRLRVNPGYGMISYDHLPIAMLNVFEIMTLEGWSDQMYMVRQAKDTYVYDLLFVLCLGIGAFFVLNLMTAV